MVVCFWNKLFIYFNFLILLYITLCILLLLILTPPLEVSMIDLDFFGGDRFPNGITQEIDAFINNKSVNLDIKRGNSLLLSFIFFIVFKDLDIKTLKLKKSLCLIPLTLGNGLVLRRLLGLLFEVLRLQIFFNVFFPIFSCLY